ncbi:hypothetical protein VCRA2119O147_1300009 [Vibrio crassostreae]|nr:hypothetical protein VCRA2112E186_140108 [Vibrio crassostreae]CAK1775446.1 hypothetical protein VCRA2112O185_140110 [Vibrio crassostreae]CAK1957490.1 hypothetical protein VCRA2112O187_270040 [Vibrio crassostreae]CAK2040894.1 hypothetical protein VCRA2112O188_310010 [Vibrio crassostreae]CAK2058224.1 hypothetical protein VCRA2112O184_340040 [Vibrio crassostreae]
MLFGATGLQSGASDYLSDFRHKQMTQVDNLSFFIQYIDKSDTPEYKPLKAYLWGYNKHTLIVIISKSKLMLYLGSAQKVGPCLLSVVMQTTLLNLLRT